MFENKAKFRENQRSKAWFLSKATYAYFFNMLRKGSKRPLNDEDFWEIDPENRAKKQFELIVNEWGAETKKKSPSLKKTLVKCNAEVIVFLSFWFLVSFLVRKRFPILRPYTTPPKRCDSDLFS